MLNSSLMNPKEALLGVDCAGMLLGSMNVLVKESNIKNEQLQECLNTYSTRVLHHATSGSHEYIRGCI